MHHDIFFVTNGLSGGGAERVLVLIANYLNNNDYNVTFIMLKDYKEAYNLNIGIKKLYKKTNNRKDFIGEIRFIRKIAKKNRNSVFISFFTRQSMYTLLASFGLKNDVIVSERNDPSRTVSGFFENFLRTILYGSKKCKKIIFQTEGAKEYFCKKIQKKGEIVLNPIKSNLPEKKECSNCKYIVSIGRLNKQKNYPLLLDAFSIFIKNYPEYELKIYGEGELKNDLIYYSKKLCIDQKVHFLGFVDDVHYKIQDASMFVMTSDYEGLSNALLEAMAMGLTCISTDSSPGGARTIIDNGINGLLVPVGDKEMLAKKMCYIASHPAESKLIGEKAKEIRKFTNEDYICQRWMKIIG